MKKILYLSSITNTQKYGFYNAVYNRMKVLKNNNEYNIIFLIIPKVDSFFIKLLKKIFGFHINDYNFKNKNFLEVVPIKKGFLGYIRNLFDKDYFDRKLFNLVEKVVLEKNIDFIHIHWAYPCGYVISQISKKYDIPYVLNIHGSDIHIHPFRDKRIMNKTIEALQSAKEIYCVSEKVFLEAQNFSKITNKKFKITHNGVFLPTINAKNLKKEYHICFIGSLEKVKGSDRLVKIFKQVSLSIPKIKLTIIGGGSYYKSIKKDIIENKLNIDLLGYREFKDIEQIRVQCDLSIVPSRSEGFPLVVLESYSYNIPVVATDCGGMSDLVLDKELLIKDDNNYIKNISDTIVKYYTNDYEKYKLKREKKEYIEYVKKYSWNEIAKEESKHYK